MQSHLSCCRFPQWGRGWELSRCQLFLCAEVPREVAVTWGPLSSPLVSTQFVCTHVAGAFHAGLRTVWFALSWPGPRITGGMNGSKAGPWGSASGNSSADPPSSQPGVRQGSTWRNLPHNAEHCSLIRVWDSGRGSEERLCPCFSLCHPHILLNSHRPYT